MNIGFHSMTVGPSNMLSYCKDVAIARGHEIVFAPAKTPPVIEEFAPCDALVICPSSRDIEREVALLDAYPDKPFYVVEDVPGAAMGRPLFVERGFPARAAGLFLAMPQWREEATQLGYKTIFTVGPPPHWGPSYEQLTAGKSLRSTFLTVDADGRTNPVGSDDIIVFLGGGKNHAFVNKLISIVTEMGLQAFGDNFVLAFRDHPGEMPARPLKDASTDDWIEYGMALSKYGSYLVTRYKMLSQTRRLLYGDATMPQTIRAADATIFYSGPTESITAAFAGMPGCLYYTDDDLRRELIEAGVPGGEWFVPELGGCAPLGDDRGRFAEILTDIVRGDLREMIRESQKKNFPLPITWDTAPLIIEKIEQLQETREVA